MDVVVAGAGLAGLTAAARLAEAGADVAVLERRDEPGGRVRSRRRDGFTLDRGFQVLLDAYPAARRELDLGALDLRPFRPGATLCRPNSRATLSDPLRDPRAAVESALTREVPLSDKLRTLALRYDLRRADPAGFLDGPDRSIRSYLDAWGFSDRYVERFVAPFYGGITLDRTLGTSKAVFEHTFRALSDGRAALPADGIGAIPDQLAGRARRAGAPIETGVTVEDVDRRSGGRLGRLGRLRGSAGGVRVRTDDGAREADAAVVATTPREARRLTGVESIPTAATGCVTQWYAFPEGVPFETGRRLLVNAADARPNTVVPVSEVAPSYAPDDRALVNATFVGGDDLDSDADDLAAATRDALDSWYPERSFEGLELVATDRIPFAQFAQPPGFYRDLPGVDAPAGPVYLAGDYTEWSSIQGALASGRAAARTVLADGEA